VCGGVLHLLINILGGWNIDGRVHIRSESSTMHMTSAFKLFPVKYFPALEMCWMCFCPPCGFLHNSGRRS